MAQLSFAAIPGFVDIPDTAIAADQPLTDDSIQKISHNAKFGAVRCEVIFMGFFQPGATVGVPSSPVDGYAYAQGEVAYIPILASTRSPAGGFVNGQKTFPSLANSDTYTGNLVASPYVLDINDSTGVLSCQVYGSTNGAQSQGTVKVYAICQRSSVNTSN